jgi:hypothetical protein
MDEVFEKRSGRRSLAPACRFLLVLVAVLIMWAVATGSASAGVLDQLQVDANSPNPEQVGGATSAQNISLGQTFTAGRTGRIDEVDLVILASANTSSPLTVSIETTDPTTNLPTGTVLGQGSVTPVSESWVKVPIVGGAPVTAGTVYAIVATTVPPAVYYWLSSASINPYTGGNQVISVAGSPFIIPIFVASDFAFQEFVDSTAPAIAITSPSDGAVYNQFEQVPANFGCTDPDSTCTVSGTVPVTAPADTSTVGFHDFTVTSTDPGGNTSSTTVKYYVSPADVQPPSISLSPPDGSTFLLNQPLPLHYSCSDPDSTCTTSLVSPSSGTPDTSTLGKHTIVVTAVDPAGNTSTTSASYYVSWKFGAVLQPTTNTKVLMALAGKTIPIEWSIKDFSGDGVPGLPPMGSLSSSRVGCAALIESTSGVGPVSAYSATNSPGVSDLGGGNYSLNWLTSKKWAGRCFKVTLTVSDGTTYTAGFRLVATAKQIKSLTKNSKKSKCLVTFGNECLVRR